MYTPGVGPKLSLNQPEKKMLDEEDKKRYQTITGAVMYLGQVSRYDNLFAVDQLTRKMSKKSPHGSGQAPTSILSRVRKLLNYLQARRVQAYNLI